MLHEFSSSQNSGSHPSKENWMEYIYGEISPSERSFINAHLDQCPTCRNQLQTWQATHQVLSSWRLNSAQNGWLHHSWGNWFRWGIAALLVLSVGILIGRSTQPSIDKTSLARVIAPEIRNSILDELKLSRPLFSQPDIAELKSKIMSEFSPANQQETAILAARLLADHQEKAFVKILDMMDQRQRASVAYLSDYLEKLEKQYATSFSSLRQDLETLALSTEGEFWRSRRHLSQLASMTQKISPQNAAQSSAPQSKDPINMNQ